MPLFPSSTVLDRPIPKAKFYDKLSVSAAMKRKFVEDVESIVWRNKLSANTLNVQAGERVVEIDVFEMELKDYDVNESVLKVIDNGVPHHILFLLHHDDRWQAVIGYKEIGKTAINLTVKEYYKTPWTEFEKLPLCISGMTMDEVFDNFVRQINSSLPMESTNTLREDLEEQERRESLQRKIDILSKKMRAEKQEHRKFELFQQIKQLKTQL